MKKLLVAVMMLWAGVVVGCAQTTPRPRLTLEQRQVDTLACSDAYMRCLKDTKGIDVFYFLDLAVEDCIYKAMRCYGMPGGVQ